MQSCRVPDRGRWSAAPGDRAYTAAAAKALVIAARQYQPVQTYRLCAESPSVTLLFPPSLKVFAAYSAQSRLESGPRLTSFPSVEKSVGGIELALVAAHFSFVQ